MKSYMNMITMVDNAKKANEEEKDMSMIDTVRSEMVAAMKNKDKERK